MATSPSLLYEVYLHAEHEEEARLASPEEARTQESASVATDGIVVEHAKSRTAMRLARRAARGAGALAVRAARASLKLAGAPASLGADEDSRRPLLAVSARGAELAVAVGGVVRAFRDEDDFQRLLAAWRPRPRVSGRGVAEPDSASSASSASREPRRGPFETDDARDDRVVSLAWAADGSAFVAATRGGDVHVVSRLGETLHTQTRGDRRSRSRAPPVACVLALAEEDGDDGDGGDARARGAKRYDLIVLARACDGGSRACAHVQRVSANEARDARRGDPPVAARRLEGAPFAWVTGAAWHEPSRTLAVVGESRRDGGASATAASSPGAGTWRFARGAFTKTNAAAPVPSRSTTATSGAFADPRRARVSASRPSLPTSSHSTLAVRCFPNARNRDPSQRGTLNPTR